MEEETPAPAPQCFRYEFFALLRNGAVVQVPIQVISPKAIDSPEVSGIREQVYRELLKQHGIGAIPRPTHYSVTELLALPAPAAAANAGDGSHEQREPRGIHLIVPQGQNGTEGGGGGGSSA